MLFKAHQKRLKTKGLDQNQLVLIPISSYFLDQISALVLVLLIHNSKS
jgi:hypothetical protein